MRLSICYPKKYSLHSFKECSWLCVNITRNYCRKHEIFFLRHSVKGFNLPPKLNLYLVTTWQHLNIGTFIDHRRIFDIRQIGWIWLLFSDSLAKFSMILYLNNIMERIMRTWYSFNSDINDHYGERIIGIGPLLKTIWQFCGKCSLFLKLLIVSIWD